MKYFNAGYYYSKHWQEPMNNCFYMGIWNKGMATVKLFII